MYSTDCMNFCSNDKQGIQYCRQGNDPPPTPPAERMFGHVIEW